MHSICLTKVIGVHVQQFAIFNLKRANKTEIDFFKIKACFEDVSVFKVLMASNDTTGKLKED